MKAMALIRVQWLCRESKEALRHSIGKCINLISLHAGGDAGASAVVVVDV